MFKALQLYAAYVRSPLLFAALNNAFDRRYVGSVNINGAAGRVLEPAPGRNALVGLEIGFSG